MQSANTEAQTWEIPSFKMSQLTRRVEVLNRRVRRTGGPGLDVVALGEVRRTHTDDVSGAPVVELWTTVAIVGDVPRVDGHQFLARVEHHSDVGNIVTVAPGAPASLVPSDARTAPPVCDHCKAARQRKDTFFLLSPSGEIVRVGRNCLADFLRSGDPEVALRMWSLLGSIRSMLNAASEEGYGQTAARGLETVGFLACTVSAIRHCGWISKAAARDNDKTATSDTARWIAGRAPEGRGREEWDRMRPTEADYEEAGEVVAWIEAMDPAALNDYLHNLRVAVSLGYVERRHEGIVASGVSARRRDLERAAERASAEAANQGRPSEHVGVVGKRYDFPGLRVMASRPTGSSFGPSVLVTLQDSDGNVLKTFLNVSESPFSAGDIVRGKGTVKDHGAYQGRKETLLCRTKFEKDPVATSPSPSPGFSKKDLPPSDEPPEFEDSSIPF